MKKYDLVMINSLFMSMHKYGHNQHRSIGDVFVVDEVNPLDKNQVTGKYGAGIFHKRDLTLIKESPLAEVRVLRFGVCDSEYGQGVVKWFEDIDEALSDAYNRSIKTKKNYSVIAKKVTDYKPKPIV